MTESRRRFRRTGLLLSLGLALAGCSNPTEDLEHGVVKLEFKRAENQAGSPYTGTVSVEITLDYLECLVDFYAAQPDYTQEGAIGLPDFGTSDQGGEGWQDRLCDDGNKEAADCNVTSIKQELVTAQHLTVSYEITGDLEDRYLNFGPLPKDELAACEGGTQPEVRVGSNGAVRGLNGAGDLVWETKSFDPDRARTGQGLAITIRAGLPD